MSVKNLNLVNLIRRQPLRDSNRSSNMRPYFAANDLENGTNAKLESVGKFLHVERFAGVKSSNVADNGFGNLVISDFLAAKRNMARTPVSLGLRCKTPLSFGITHVIGMRSKEKVSVIAAWRIVASMANVKIARLAKGEFPSKTMGFVNDAVERKTAITKMITCPSPRPTFGVSQFANSGPELRDSQRGSFMGLFHNRIVHGFGAKSKEIE